MPGDDQTPAPDADLGDAVMWRDGELIPFAEATVHVLSHAAHRGSEVFDVLRVVDSKGVPNALGLRPHVARFDRSMQLMGMETPYDLGILEAAVADTVGANPGSAYVKLVAVWAEVAMSTEPESRRPSVLIAALPGPGAAEIMAGPPVRIHTAEMPKMPAVVLPPSLKVAASYTAALRHQLPALAEGWDDVIFRSTDGMLAEATTKAMLVVNGDRVLAPPFDTVLDSITRRLLLDLVPFQDLATEVRDVAWDEVIEADELILTSTTGLVVPVGQLDDVKLDAPGPVAQGLIGAVTDLIAGDHPLSDRWLAPLT
jgi:branched-chain amino acid aminotransferase